jgi:hypothetical protein
MPTCNKRWDRSKTSLTHCCEMWKLCENAEGQQRSRRRVFVFWQYNETEYDRHVKSTSPTLWLNTRSIHLWRWRRISFNIRKTLQARAKPSKEWPAFLLLDNHDSHLSIEALDFYKQNGVTVFSFPPHCSHKLQPLNVSVYGSLKDIREPCAWHLGN